MTYASFLLVFLLPPMLWLLVALRPRGPRRALLLPAAVSVVAVLYTTLWDNYLVASRIWWYDPQRISGILLGWVPLEEYLFFLLQPLLTGYWTLWILRAGGLGRRVVDRVAIAGPAADEPVSPSRKRIGQSVRISVSFRREFTGPVANSTSAWIRLAVVLPLGLMWAGSWWALRSEASNLHYLALILIWALPPLALQLAYGAPSLWRLRWTALWSIVPATLYLAAADSLAISAGIWTINPASSIGWLLLGVLPLEELLFFLLTNALIAFSVLLIAGPRVRSTAGPDAADQH